MKVLIFLTLLLAAAYADHCGAATGWKWFWPKWDATNSDYDWSLQIDATQQAQHDAWCEINCEHSSQLHPACFVGTTSDAGVTVDHRCFCGETTGTQGNCQGTTNHGTGSGSTAGDCPANSWKWYEPGWVNTAGQWAYDWTARSSLDNWCETTCRHTSQLAPACLLQTHEGQNVNIHHRCFCEGAQPQGLHFVVVLDESGSMGNGASSRWEIAKQGLQNFINARGPTNPLDRLTVVTFSNQRRTRASRVALAGYNILTLTKQGGSTQHSHGINGFIDQFPTPAAETQQIVLFYLGDGGGTAPNTQLTTLNSITALINKIHSVYVFGVGSGSATSALTTIATSLSGTFTGYTNQSSFNSYFTALATSIVE